MIGKDEYIRELEKTIGKFLTPLKGIPFPIAIKALTGFEVIPFDATQTENKKLLESMSKVAQIAGMRASIKGIFANRPNEAGNHIEPFVLGALNEAGLKADTPVAKSGRKQTVGYPDIQIEDEYGRTVYLECKTFSSKMKGTTFRSFYFSPSKNPKITKNAFHLLMSFELLLDARGAFIPVSWQIYTLDELLIQVKHEFNASNKDLYTEKALLASGKIG